MKQPVSVAICLCLVLSCCGAARAGTQPIMLGQGECQILDAVTEPIYEVGLSIVPNSSVGESGDTALVELDARWDVAYFRDVLYADLDLAFEFSGILVTDSAGLQLPDQLVQLNLDAGLAWRFVGGTALQFGLKPGIYSDFEEVSADALAFPSSLALIQSFDPTVSGIIGLELRPSFETKIMPLIGVAWQPLDVLRVEAGLPRSRLSCVFNNAWSGHLGLTWNNVSYQLREKGDFDRKRLEVEDFRLYAGATRRLSDLLQITGEIGHRFDRQFEFRYTTDDLPRKVEVEDAFYIRVGVGGPF
jgi:hypothetical protein